MSLRSFKALVQRFSDRVRRHRYVSAQIRNELPLQIRAMRMLRGWSQSDLATRMGTSQNVVSRLETPGSCKPTTTTLLKLSEAFDVALVVSFMPFSRYTTLASEGPSKNSVAIPSYEEEQRSRTAALPVVSESREATILLLSSSPIEEWESEIGGDIARKPPAAESQYGTSASTRSAYQ